MDILNQLSSIIKEIQEHVICTVSLPDSPSASQIVQALRVCVITLIDQLTNTQNAEYQELEKLVQKNEAELEQQMKIYTDGLQDKIETLEKDNNKLLQQVLAHKSEQNESKQMIKDLEKQLFFKTNPTLTRDPSPNIVLKKNFIVHPDTNQTVKANNIFTQQKDSKESIKVSVELMNRERKTSTTHVNKPYQASLNPKQIYIKNTREQRLSQHSQEKQPVLDKSLTKIQSQNSVQNIKMYNISKLLLKNQQDLAQVKSQQQSVHISYQNGYPRPESKMIQLSTSQQQK